MRVLVTGHHGYIGTVMVPVLQQASHEVVGLDSDLFADCVHGPAPEEVPSLRVDLRDLAPEHLEGIDAVIHLAALSNDPLGDLEPEHTYDINHHASVRLAEVSKTAGVSRFLYSSSCSIYGASDSSRLLDETAPLRPVTAYAESKVAVESELVALADETFTPVSLRNATAYGWSPRLRCDIVLNDLVAGAFLTGAITVLSDGTPWRPIVHIADISAVFAAALAAPRDAIHAEAINVGSAQDNHQVSDIAGIVAEAVPGSELRITGETGPDPRSYQVDFTKLSERLPEFQPAWDARRGAKELYDAFLQHGLDEHAYRHTFKRLPTLLRLRDEGVVDGSLRRRD